MRAYGTQFSQIIPKLSLLQKTESQLFPRKFDPATIHWLQVWLTHLPPDFSVVQKDNEVQRKNA
jgi:hypothetical protein